MTEKLLVWLLRSPECYQHVTSESPPQQEMSHNPLHLSNPSLLEFVCNSRTNMVPARVNNNLNAQSGFASICEEPNYSLLQGFNAVEVDAVAVSVAKERIWLRDFQYCWAREKLDLHKTHLPTCVAVMASQSEGKVTAAVHAHHDMGYRYQGGRPLTQRYSQPFP